jgi:hypothetical protein
MAVEFLPSFPMPTLVSTKTSSVACRNGTVGKGGNNANIYFLHHGVKEPVAAA